MRSICPIMRSICPIAFALLCVFGFGPSVRAADYYLSPTGSDSSPGTRSQPWQSLAKVNATLLVAGDRVLLASGATFTGSLVLSDKEAGTPGRPVVICSSGKGRATILSPGRTAISAVCGGITIQNLTLRGGATPSDHSDKALGIAFYIDDKQGVKYRGLRIDDVEITGFGGDGLSIGAGGEAGAGYEDVRITRATVHDNYGTGLITFDKVSSDKASYAHKDFFIADCTLGRNHAGTGMVISGVSHAVVEFCRAFDNDGKGGGVGIWAYAAQNVTFRDCIASGTTTDNGGDGGGFDLDGACVGCAVESCLTYGNDGPGYMHCDYPSATPTRGNVIRASVSVNDGRKAKGGPYGFGLCTWGSGLDSCTIAGNMALVTDSDLQGRQNGVYWVSYIPESVENANFDKGRQHLSGGIFQNNIAVVTGSGVAYVSSDLPGAIPANVQFTGNSFRSGKDVSPTFVQGETRFPTLAQWRAATGQETHSSPANSPSLPLVRPEQAPALARSLSQITDPRRLPGLSVMKALRLQSASRR